MAISIEKTGARVYLVGDTYAVKARIKAIGGHWDGERRAWWVGAAKATEAAAIAGDSGAATGGDKPAEKEDPKSIRLVGKAKYKGRTYYVRWVGATKQGGYKARLTNLDGTLDFWADAARFGEPARDDVAVVVKEYAPRTRYYRGHERTEYTTLGSIQRFLRQQNNPETARGECSECGAWGLVGTTCRECREGTH